MSSAERIDQYQLSRQNIHLGLIEAVEAHIEDKHITQDKLAREVRMVSQMAAMEGNYKEALNGYRLVGELKRYITKNGDVPPPSGGVHQHNHVHLHEQEMDQATTDDLQAQLQKIAVQEANIKQVEAEVVDDVDLD